MALKRFFLIFLHSSSHSYNNVESRRNNMARKPKRKKSMWFIFVKVSAFLRKKFKAIYLGNYSDRKGVIFLFKDHDFFFFAFFFYFFFRRNANGSCIGRLMKALVWTSVVYVKCPTKMQHCLATMRLVASVNYLENGY